MIGCYFGPKSDLASCVDLECFVEAVEVVTAIADSALLLVAGLFVSPPGSGWQALESP